MRNFSAPPFPDLMETMMCISFLSMVKCGGREFLSLAILREIETFSYDTILANNHSCVECLTYPRRHQTKVEAIDPSDCKGRRGTVVYQR